MIDEKAEDTCPPDDEYHGPIEPGMLFHRKVFGVPVISAVVQVSHGGVFWDSPYISSAFDFEDRVRRECRPADPQLLAKVTTNV